MKRTGKLAKWTAVFLSTALCMAMVPAFASEIPETESSTEDAAASDVQQVVGSAESAAETATEQTDGETSGTVQTDSAAEPEQPAEQQTEVNSEETVLLQQSDPGFTLDLAFEEEAGYFGYMVQGNTAYLMDAYENYVDIDINVTPDGQTEQLTWDEFVSQGYQISVTTDRSTAPERNTETASIVYRWSNLELTDDDATITVTVTSPEGNTATETIGLQVEKFTPGKIFNYDNLVLQAAPLEMSQDGITWTHVAGTEADPYGVYELPLGFQGYLRYEATELQNAGEATYIYYTGTAQSEDRIRISKVWEDGTTPQTVTVVVTCTDFPGLPGTVMGSVEENVAAGYLVLVKSATLDAEGSPVVEEYSDAEGNPSTFKVIYTLELSEGAWDTTIRIPTGEELEAAGFDVDNNIATVGNFQVTETVNGVVCPCELSGNTEDGFTITNRASRTADISVRKEWADGVPQGTVKVALVRDGELVGDTIVTLSEENGWAGSFPDVPLFAEDGHAYEYSVQEITGGYQYTVTGDTVSGFVIRNTGVSSHADASVPQTGDSSVVSVLFTMMIAAGGLFTVTAVRRKTSEH